MEAGTKVESDQPTEFEATAIREIEQLVLAAYPDASFETDHDPATGTTWVNIRADFDPDGWDDVVDLYMERLLEMQEESGLWLHFLPISIRGLSNRVRAA